MICSNARGPAASAERAAARVLTLKKRRTMNLMRGVHVVSVVVVVAAIAAPANAQTYPTRPIRLLVGFPVGGGADVAARVLGARISDALGQQIIVDNRPGAGSAIASEIAAKATPDGHTLV